MMVFEIIGCIFIALCGWLLLHSYLADAAETPREDAVLGAIVMCVGALGIGVAAWAMKGGAQ